MPTEPKKEVMLHNLFVFATKNKGDEMAASVLMSFFRGECEHFPDENGKCELCGVVQSWRMRS